jgi:hypothetical protein
MTLVSSPSVSAAITNQEAYYISVLKPKNMPKAKESYPAKLIVDIKQTAMLSPARLEFKGNCGVNTEISDDELLKLLKESLKAVDSYKGLQNPVDDVLLVKELTDKLKFSDEDIDEILENWKKMLGLDEAFDLINGNIPIPESADAINAIIDGAQGENPLKPGPSVVGAFVDGVFITYEQYQKDIQKWDNIVKLSQAKARIRAYNYELAEKIRAYLAENGDWKITINAQTLSDMTYYQMPNAARLLWTADIDLKKTDGGFTTVAGGYSGLFSLKMDADFSPFDDGYAAYYANKLSPPGGFQYSVTGNSGPFSELKLEYEIPNCKLNISLPHGVNRHFFEENIPSSSLTQTQFTINVERTVQVTAPFGGGKLVEDWQIIEHDGVWATSQTTTNIIPGTPTQSTTNNDGGSDPWPPDTRGAVTMTLVIDMLGK